jgi:ATP-binding cassette subfamily C (CFTR/MRP) protein 10
MPFLPDCFSALATSYDGASVALQRYSLLLLLDALLACHLAPAVFQALPAAPPSALLLLLCLALAALALAALPLSALGYCVLHAALCCALLALALAARCRPLPPPPLPPLPPRPDTKPWLALCYLLLAAGLAHSAALRLQACAGDTTLAWLDAALAGLLAAAAAAAFGNALFASPAAAEGQGGAALEGAAVPLLAAASEGGGGLQAEEEEEEETGEEGRAGKGAAPAAAELQPPHSLHDAATTAAVWTFSWMDGLFTAGLTRQLGLGDLEGLPALDATAPASAELQAALEAGASASAAASAAAAAGVAGSAPPAPSLALTLLQCYGRAWAVVGLLQAGCVLTALAAPLALKGLLEYLQGAATAADAPGPLVGLAWVAALGAVQGASALCTTQLNYRVTRLQLRVRGGLVSALQRRVLCAPLGVRRGLSSGNLTNLVSVDVDRVLNLIPSFHQFWTLPLQVVAVVAELQAQVSYAALGGVGVLCVMVPLNIYVAQWLGSLTAVMMTARDARVAATGEVLGGMRAVKLSGWEVPLLQRVGGHRAAEFSALATRKYLDAVCVWCWASTPLLMALTTFALTLLLPNEQAFFTPAKVWASLAMLNLLIFPLNAFPWVLSGLLEARVSLQRLDAFLVGSGAVKNNDSDSNSNSNSNSSNSNSTLVIVEGGGALVTARGDFAHAQGVQKDEGEGEGKEAKGGNAAGRAVAATALAATARASTGGEGDAAPFVLHLGPQGVTVAPGELVCVCGAMASGKSSLLLALLGELCSSSSSAAGAAAAAAAGGGAVPAARTELSAACTVTYAPQVPWVRDGSLTENIVFGEPHEPARLRRVLDVTGLTEEARERGLRTPVTETMLSGGQRARIGLARTLYARSALVLLDGVTAALDARVAVAVWTATVAFCREEGRACVAVVGDARYLGSADRVLVLGQGGVVLYSGAPAALPAQVLEASGLHAAAAATAAAAAPEGSSGSGGAPGAPAPAAALAAAAAPAGDKEPAAEEEVKEEEEFREKGYVKGSVLAEYARATGLALTCTVLASALAMQASRNAADAWLSVWSSSAVANGASDPFSALSRYLVARQWGTRDFLVLYAALANANFVLTALRAWSFARAGLRAAARLHTRLLVGVVGAAQAFHDATPSGRLLNRLSGDVFAMDDSLPFSVNILLAQFVGLAGTVVILGVSTFGLFLLLLPILCLSFLRLQARYRATSRELKRVDATTRSPLLTHFSDMRRGEAVLLAASLNRAPTAAASPLHRERARGLALLDHSQRTTFASGMAGQWLGLRLQALGMLVLGLLCLFCFLLRVFSSPAQAARYDDGCPAPPGACAPPSPPPSPAGAAGGGAAAAAASLGSASVAGLILSLSLPVVYQLQGLLGAFTDTEKEFISVERALEYAALPAEDAASVPAMEEALGGGSAPHLPQPPLPWQPPHNGLVLEGVRVTYPGAPAPALQLSLALPPGTRLGVVGRTGSGKSTLLALLWRLVPYEGRVTLGGEETARVPLAALRAALCIVPQEPLLLRGTLRFNLDPWGREAAGALEGALVASGLRDSLLPLAAAAAAAAAVAAAAAAPAGGGAPPPAPPTSSGLLELHIEEGGRNLSLGQQQLVCLARAMLRAPPLLALDEAAAAADAAAHALLQAALRGGFAGTTVIVVAHRLESVLGCDQVLVLHGGEAVELGPPRELLARRGGAFAALVAESQRALA